MSDQDFFFDEDDQPAEKPAEKAAATPAQKTTSGTTAAPRPASRAAAQTVSYTVAGLIGVCTLLLGVIIGLALPSDDVASSTTSNPLISAPVQDAPQLSPEQMQAGVMPEGHPPVDGGEAAPTETATGTVDDSAETTPAE